MNSSTTRHRRRRAATLLAGLFGLGIVISQVAVALASPSDLQGAKIASGRFHSVDQALAAGYGPFPQGVPLHECIMSLNNTGGMGIHYVNGSLLDTTVDASQPEVLVYAPDESGKLKLVALEYVVFQGPWKEANGQDAPPPSLFGVSFKAIPEPNRYEIPAFYALHAWIWNSNPSGIFADFNPDITCP